MRVTATAIDQRLVVPRRHLGLWTVMLERLRCDEPLPTVDVASLTPVPTMFDYDVDTAVALVELPHEIG